MQHPNVYVIIYIYTISSIHTHPIPFHRHHHIIVSCFWLFFMLLLSPHSYEHRQSITFITAENYIPFSPRPPKKSEKKFVGVYIVHRCYMSSYVFVFDFNTQHTTRQTVYSMYRTVFISMSHTLNSLYTVLPLFYFIPNVSSAEVDPNGLNHVLVLYCIVFVLKCWYKKPKKTK